MFRQVFDQLEGSDGAQRFVFQRVVDIETKLFAGAEERHDDLSHMIDRYRHPLHAGTPELCEHDFENRTLADRHERFRQRGRVRPQPYAFATRQDYGSHYSLPLKIINAYLVHLYVVRLREPLYSFPDPPFKTIPSGEHGAPSQESPRLFVRRPQAFYLATVGSKPVLLADDIYLLSH